MTLDVALTWAELNQQDLSRSVVIVADILRATTVMITALTHGAQCIIPQDNDEKARYLYKQMIEQGKSVLLCGEKEGYKREGYDLGNSPLEFTPERVAGKSIIHLTTNGTRALVAASQAQETLIVSFANLSAIARYLRSMDAHVDRIIGVVSGHEGSYCLEDTVCLGGVMTALLEPPGRIFTITDAARSAVDLYQLYRARLLDMARQCFHGRNLEEIGLGSDLPECVKVDTTDIVPRMKNGQIRL